MLKAALFVKGSFRKECCFIHGSVNQYVLNGETPQGKARGGSLPPREARPGAKSTTTLPLKQQSLRKQPFEKVFLLHPCQSSQILSQMFPVT